MRILPAIEEEIRGVIRDERAKDPLITVDRLEKALEAHFNRGFAYNYVAKVADKAYDADWLRRQIEAAGAAPNIPPKANRRWKPCFSPVLYRARDRLPFTGLHRKGSTRAWARLPGTSGLVN
jgi:hypothetical protein